MTDGRRNCHILAFFGVFIGEKTTFVYENDAFECSFFSSNLAEGRMCIANLKCKGDNFMAFYDFNDNFLKI
jgi:hypothetical protein